MNKGRIGAVGMFDGVHQGHRYLLRELRREADARGLEPVAITFARHPLSEINPDRTPAQLSTTAQREALLRDEGVDVMTLDFNDIRHLTAAQFLSRLRERGFNALMMGFNNHIGSDRLDVNAAAELGVIPVLPCAEAPGEAQVSSTAVRNAVTQGDMRAAARMLGRPFSVAGTVEHGQGLGHTIGFPTANVKAESELQQLPAPGVYAVMFRYGGGSYPGMANLGSRPTVNGNETTLEVNVFDFDENLYGARVEVEFIERMRSESRFPTVEALAAQLGRDREQALSLLKRNP